MNFGFMTTKTKLYIIVNLVDGVLMAPGLVMGYAAVFGYVFSATQQFAGACLAALGLTVGIIGNVIVTESKL